MFMATRRFTQLNFSNFFQSLQKNSRSILNVSKVNFSLRISQLKLVRYYSIRIVAVKYVVLIRFNKVETTRPMKIIIERSVSTLGDALPGGVLIRELPN